MNNHPEADEVMRLVEANGLAIGCSISGSGPPLLLIHGAEATRDMFAALAPRLASRFTVIAYDQRDSGTTRDLTDPPRTYALADMADDAAELIRALGFVRAHVVGTSLGGHIAQVLAARHPDCIDRLALMSTWLAGCGLAAVNPSGAEQLGLWRTDAGRYAGNIAGMFFTPKYLQAHPEQIDMFRGSSRTAEQSARRARLLGVPYSIEKGQIEAPTLLLMGDQDRLIPNAATLALADIVRWPQAHVLHGVGHIAPIEAPEELAAAIVRFLAA